MTIEKVKAYFEKHIHLGDYDLDGVEITDEDFKIIVERYDKSISGGLEDIIINYLYEIREVLDFGLKE